MLRAQHPVVRRGLAVLPVARPPHSSPFWGAWHVDLLPAPLGPHIFGGVPTATSLTADEPKGRGLVPSHQVAAIRPVRVAWWAIVQGIASGGLAFLRGKSSLDDQPDSRGKPHWPAAAPGQPYYGEPRC